MFLSKDIFLKKSKPLAAVVPMNSQYKGRQEDWSWLWSWLWWWCVCVCVCVFVYVGWAS